MKLRNKKTNMVVDVELVAFDANLNKREVLTFEGEELTIKKLYDEFEDVKEEKWFISDMGQVHKFGEYFGEVVVDDKREAIGNYFETKEEAEQAVEKLKAWKRLKDKGFKFTDWATNEGIRGIDFEVPDSFFSEHNHSCISDETRDDLDLLFGGEE